MLYDLNPAAFMRNLEDFVKQVPEVDYLNLFVSSLEDADSSKILFKDIARDDRKTQVYPPSLPPYRLLPPCTLHKSYFMLTSSVPTDKVNLVCDALRGILERDVVQYIETILTAHVCKRPADYEAGLRVLHKLQGELSRVLTLLWDMR